MKISAIMTRKVFYLGKNNSVSEAVKIMGSEDVGAIPITDQFNKVIGIITDRDIVIRCLYQDGSLELALENYMTPNVTTVEEEATIGTVITLMSEKQIKRIPVTNHEGKLTGIVSLGDLATHSASDGKSSEALRNISLPSNDHVSNPNHDNKVDNFPL
ncbi:CBS domain-containing protein [Mycoplasmatota bacterium zrk1]